MGMDQDEVKKLRAHVATMRLEFNTVVGIAQQLLDLHAERDKRDRMADDLAASVKKYLDLVEQHGTSDPAPTLGPPISFEPAMGSSLSSPATARVTVPSLPEDDRLPRRANKDDYEADAATHAGRLRRMAFLVQQCTVNIGGVSGEAYLPNLVGRMLTLADELEAMKRPRWRPRASEAIADDDPELAELGQTLLEVFLDSGGELVSAPRDKKALLTIFRLGRDDVLYDQDHCEHDTMDMIGDLPGPGETRRIWWCIDCGAFAIGRGWGVDPNETWRRPGRIHAAIKRLPRENPEAGRGG